MNRADVLNGVEAANEVPKSYVQAMQYLWQMQDQSASAYRYMHKCLQQSKQKAAMKDLPMYVFVAGVEGSGHHFIANLLRWNVSIAMKGSSSAHVHGIVPATLKRRNSEYTNKLRHKLFSRVSNGDIILEAAPSYPIGNPYRATRHPDLRRLMQLDGSLFDLRVIVPVRNPLDAVLSTHHTRGWVGARADPAIEAAVTVECLVHINAVLDTIPCGKLALMPLKYAAQQPQDARRALDALLDLGAKQNSLKYRRGGMDLDTNRNSYTSQALRMVPSSVQHFVDSAISPSEQHSAHSDATLSTHVHGHAAFRATHPRMLKLLDQYFREQRALFPLLDPT